MFVFKHVFAHRRLSSSWVTLSIYQRAGRNAVVVRALLARSWARTQLIEDERVRAEHIRYILLPYLRDLGYPNWFHVVIVNFTRGVVDTGRPYSLEELVSLLECTYGISPASPVPRFL